MHLFFLRRGNQIAKFTELLRGIRLTPLFAVIRVIFGRIDIGIIARLMCKSQQVQTFFLLPRRTVKALNDTAQRNCACRSFCRTRDRSHDISHSSYARHAEYADDAKCQTDTDLTDSFHALLPSFFLCSRAYSSAQSFYLYHITSKQECISSAENFHIFIIFSSSSQKSVSMIK